MSDSPDIVDRLRDLAGKPVMLAELTRAFRDAADEIERLRVALKEAEARGRAQGLEEAIRMCMRARLDFEPSDGESTDDAYVRACENCAWAIGKATGEAP